MVWRFLAFLPSYTNLPTHHCQSYHDSHDIGQTTAVTWARASLMDDKSFQVLLLTSKHSTDLIGLVLPYPPITTMRSPELAKTAEQPRLAWFIEGSIVQFPDIVSNMITSFNGTSSPFSPPIRITFDEKITTNMSFAAINYTGIGKLWFLVSDIWHPLPAIRYPPLVIRHQTRILFTTNSKF
jgi:hypothetical protein